MRGGYDYRLGDGMVGGGSGGMVGAGGRPGDASLAGSAAPQWWYPSGMGNPIQNVPTPPSVVCILPLRRVCEEEGMFTFLLPLRTLVFLQLPGSFCHLNNFLNQEMSVHSCV